MAITIVNDYFFKRDGDLDAGKAAAAELVDYFNHEVPEVQLSLWLESDENPLHHYHITVFDDAAVVRTLRESAAIKRFTDRLYSQIDHSTFVSPSCNVWLTGGRGVESVGYGPS